MSDVKLSNSNFLWLAKEQLYVPRNCTGCPTTPPLTSATWISPASYTLATKGPEGSFSPFTVTSTMWVPTSVGTNSTLWTPEACARVSHTIWHICQLLTGPVAGQHSCGYGAFARCNHVHDEVVGGNVGVGDYLENCRSVGWHQPSGLAHHWDAGPGVCHYVDVPGAAFNSNLIWWFDCFCDVKSWIYTVGGTKVLDNATESCSVI